MRGALFFSLLCATGLSCARGTDGPVEDLDRFEQPADASAGVQAPTGPAADDAGDDDFDEGPETPAAVVGGADAGGPDGGALDGGRADAGKVDAAAPRDGSVQAPVDAGRVVVDAGPRDAGVPPAAPLDAGPSEAVDAGAAGDAGAQPEPVPEPEPEPTGPECAPGTYAGTFQGDISALLGIIQRKIAGTITIDVELAGRGDELRIRNGSLAGEDEEGNPVAARVSGTLNCRTKRLENGQLTNGTYRAPDPITGQLSTTNFQGTATANYTSNPPSAAGRWDVSNLFGTRGGEGTWSAELEK